MRINSESRIHHPIDVVYKCYRDHLPQVAPYTPDIKEIIVNQREELDNGPKIHNIWVADRELPKIAQGIIKPGMMQWDDFAQWDDANRHVDWRITPCGPGTARGRACPRAGSSAATSAAP